MFPSELDTGASLAFMNYIANYYNVAYSGQNAHSQRSLWASFNGGINLGAWQYRQLSNMTWDNDKGNQWNNIRSYLQRPLPAINSQLMMGQLITSGRFSLDSVITALVSRPMNVCCRTPCAAMRRLFAAWPQQTPESR